MAGTRKVQYTAAEHDWLRTHSDLTQAELIAAWPADFTPRTASGLYEQRKRLLRGDAVDPPGINSRDLSNAERLKRLGKIATLLEASGIALEDIATAEKIRLNTWEGFYKDNEGEAHKVQMEAAAIVLSPKWAEGPQWPLPQPAPPITLTPIALPPKRRVTGMHLAVILTDLQIGYWRDRAGVLHPTHDEAAIAVALQIVQAVQADRIILIGDTVDFPELSRYRTESAFAQTTQATINRTATLLAALRGSTRQATAVDWLEGNHEVRLPHYIQENAAAAFGLRPGNRPDAWPVLSIPTLCRLDEFRVTYHPGYPANVIWLNDRLMVIHGNRAGAGINAAAYLKHERVSVIYAHIHRRELAEVTQQTRHGPWTTMAACPGCLCRTDGVVPSHKSGRDLDGVPVTTAENWQQGIAVVSYDPEGEGRFIYEPIAIEQGVAYWRGERFSAPCDVEGESPAA